MARGRRIIDDSSDGEFPDLQDLGSFKTKWPKGAAMQPAKHLEEPANKGQGTVRRRKLGNISDNALLRPLNEKGSSQTTPKQEVSRGNFTIPRRIELRTRKTKPVVQSVDIDDLSEAESIQEKTIIEDFSGDDESDFQASRSSESEGDDSTASFLPLRSPPSKSFWGPGYAVKDRELSGDRKRSPSPSEQLLAEAIEAQERDDSKASGTSRAGKSKGSTSFKKADVLEGSTAFDLANPIPKLRIDGFQVPKPASFPSDISIPRPTTPTSRSPHSKPKGLISPTKKITRIPATPHRSHTDTFWNQEFIDEWNDEHSPKKQLFLPEVSRSPSKKSPTRKGEPSAIAVAKAAKKAFEQSKHSLADKFLRELDAQITDNKISELSASTGGIRIDWTNKLNTTAGRANWKRETIKRKEEDEKGAMVTTSVRYSHHASIELAEKVIDDEGRLLNVIAHEFCHLANFMISGVTTNPHGKEFKSWADKVTRAFAGRGIQVTTKHSYDIDFKYAWECTLCGLEFKRHSKSINTERHRCGACKSELKQTKPVPRAKPGKESDYQKFMKDQMKVIKQENPGIPQKDIMKMVASRWSQKEKEKGSFGAKKPSSSTNSAGKDKVEGVAKAFDKLTLIDLT